MRINNDHHNNQRSSSAGSAMVRQRAIKPSDAKVDSQANGTEEGASPK